MAVHFANVPEVEALLGLMLSLPSVAIILSAALFGVMAERFGRMPMLMIALSLYAMGGASGLFADTMTSILIGRIVLGVGVAGTMTIAMMLAGELWNGPARMKFMGKQSATMSLGGVVFITFGGFLAEISWRGAFALYLLALPVAVLALMYIKPQPKPHKRAGGQKVPLDWGVCLKIGALGFMTMAIFYVIPVRLPFVLADIGVTSTAVSGMILASVTLSGVLTSMNFQRIGRALSPIAIYAVCFGLFAIGYGLIGTATTVFQIVIGTLTTGLALGAIMPNQNSWLMSVIAPEARGRAAGLMTTFVFLGQFCGPMFAGLLGMFLSLKGIFIAFALVAASISALLFFVARISAGNAAASADRV
ncbi:MFS transporter [Yoonia sp. SS1-5]|uniref:MFS transporter n=1 Tax=Yoonia rhodophyticola TaxID=3137370 RepID=A0AAN0M9H4_9RHOB